jgi:hypothetical protein
LARGKLYFDDVDCNVVAKSLIQQRVAEALDELGEIPSYDDWSWESWTEKWLGNDKHKGTRDEDDISSKPT